MLSGLAVLALAEVTAAWYHLPGGPVAASGACALPLLAWRIGQLDRKSLVRGMSSSLFGFLPGMVIVVRGSTERGPTERFGTWLLARRGIDPARHPRHRSRDRARCEPDRRWTVGSGRARSTEDQCPATLPQAALRDATLLGADPGPNVTTVGSLAMILWLLLLRRYGITLSVRQYNALGLPVPPLLLAGLLANRLQT